MKNMKKGVSLVLVIAILATIVASSGFGIVEASAISVPSCSGFISNSEHRQYIDLMMNYYINNNSSLQTALNNGKSVVFMFEGGSDNYPSTAYSTSSSNQRKQAVVIVIQKKNGTVQIAFYDEYCSSVPAQPEDTNGTAGNRQTILIDGIYGLETCNHTNDSGYSYGALHVKTSQGLYTPPSNKDGIMNTAYGINVHTRSSYNNGSYDSAWSWGCQVIGGANDSSNTFNTFMKTVTGISYNVWLSWTNKSLNTITAYQDVGYYVVDRYLAQDGLKSLYNQTAINKITAYSRSAYAAAATAYLDVNGWLDGQSVSNISGYGTCDVYVNGQRVANDCSDYYTDHQVGFSYEIKDIRPVAGYSYDGIHSGSRTGSVSSGGTNVVLQFSRIRLADVTASPQIGYYGGHTYYYYDTPVTVYTAKAFCESLGGHLVSLNDAAENDLVKTMFPAGTRVWIGATDEASEGSWKWDDGSSLTFSDWSGEEPNNSYGDVADCENFAHYTTDGKWNDTNGCQTYGFVCEIDGYDHDHDLQHIKAVAATCNGGGNLEYWICSACGNCFADVQGTMTIDEDQVLLQKLEHDYEEIGRVSATCTKPAGTKYQCALCGNSYVEYDEADYSEWSEDYPVGIDESLIESRTEYRYREKEHDSSSSNSMPGWEPEGSSYTWGEWGDYDPEWSRTPIAENEYTQVKSEWVPATYRTEYNYSRYNEFNPATDGKRGWNGPTVGYWGGHYCQYYAEYGWTSSPLSVTGSDSGYTIYGSDNGSWYNQQTRQVEVTAGYTRYTSRTRGKIWTYSFWRWSPEWSDWSANEVTATDDCQVETRTVYRYINGETHSWGEWEIVRPASCTEEGEKNRICSKCNDRETEVIPATGHDYSEESVYSTCTQSAGIRYTCVNCGDSYTEYEISEYTEWSEDYPVGVDESLIESKTEYRFRERETKTSSDGPSGSNNGWTLTNSSYVWGSWKDGSPSGDDDSRTLYYYFYYTCPVCGRHNYRWHGCVSWDNGCGHAGSENEAASDMVFHDFWSTLPYSSTYDYYDTSRWYSDSTEQGRAFRWKEGTAGYVSPKTQHREKIWTYSYERWSDWSDWSEEAVTETDDRQVETRTLYRCPNIANHSWGEWEIKTPATCTTDGVMQRTCTECGEIENETVAAIGHNYLSEVVPATCEQYEGVKYTCEHCGDTYTEYSELQYSEWSETYPEGVDESLIESKTEYRYSDYDSKESDAASMTGYSVKSSRWEQTGTGSVQYVSSWPSGFYTGHNLYSKYHNSPKTASETATTKTEITGTSTIGYLYYHWCRGTYTSGPINRGSKAVKTYEDAEHDYNTFHAFFETRTPQDIINAGPNADGKCYASDGSYVYAYPACCVDSYWYFPIPVYQQNYKTYKKVTTFERWTDWSEWSEEEVTETDTRRVETRTLYRYAINALGQHEWGEWEVVTPATCTEDGERSRTCSICQTVETEAIPAAHTWDAEGQYCTVCEAENPEFIPLGIKVGSVSAQPGETVTVPVTITENSGFSAFTFTLNCAEGLTLTAFTKGEVLNSAESGFFDKDLESGNVTWFTPESITSNGVLFNLTVTLPEDAEPGTYAISIALKDSDPSNFVDADSQPIPLRLINGGINLSAHEHSYSEETTSATCTEDGVTIYTCECGDTYSEVILSPGHDIVTDAAIDPTCTESGLTEGCHCTRCDYAVAQEEIAAIGHDLVVTAPAVAATCTERGRTEAAYCTFCDYETVSEEIAPLGHDIIEEVLFAPNCTEEGASEFTCSRCDYYEAKFTPALDHDYVEEVLFAPTCTEEGASEFTCTRCDYYEAKFTPALGHDYVLTSETPATCTEDGSRISTCSRCQDAQTEVLPKREHHYKLTDERAPTCTKDGSKTYVCLNCTDTYTDTVPALGHNYEGKVLIVPTCVKQGLIKYTCTRPGCGSTYSEKIDPAHSFGTPTDNGDGTHTLSCTVCTYFETEAHTYTDGVCACGALDPNAKQFRIVSASLRLDEDLNLIYAVELPDGYSNPYMDFLFHDVDYAVEDYTVNDDGQYCFELTDINPQCMGDNICATVYATKDGEEVSVCKAEYSIRQYCINQLTKTDDGKLITLLSDILTYGTAAQIYMDYKTDALVTDGLDLTPSTFDAISGKTVSFTGEQDENTCWTGAALVLSNDLATRFTFVTDSTDGLSIEVAIDGRTQTFDAFEDAGDGRYCITFDGIQATEFDDTVTAKFIRNGKQLGAAVNYSVNTYICSTQNSTNEPLAALVQALYNYGASAKFYADTNK